MGAAIIITFRETLEAALVVGILLAFLKKTENMKHRKYVWWGVVFGILVSGILAWVFETWLGGFEGRAEEIYEGVMMIVAAGLITWMILWMLKQRKGLKKNLENKAEAHLKEDHPMGLFVLSFISVAREGIETVIFLKAAMLQADGGSVLFGGFIGVLIAIVFAVLLFQGFEKVPLRKFFTATSVLLILFGAGLLAHGFHEFQEAGIIPIFNEHLWDINGILNEKGPVGSIMKGLFGYNGNPSLIEVVSYLVYLFMISVAWRRIDKRS